MPRRPPSLCRQNKLLAVSFSIYSRDCHVSNVFGIVDFSDANRAFRQTLKRGMAFLTALWSDIEKWDAKFATTRADSSGGDGKNARGVWQCRRCLRDGVPGFPGLLGLEVGDRAGCAVAQQDCGNHPAHDGDN